MECEKSRITVMSYNGKPLHLQVGYYVLPQEKDTNVPEHVGVDDVLIVMPHLRQSEWPDISDSISRGLMEQIEIECLKDYHSIGEQAASCTYDVQGHRQFVPESVLSIAIDIALCQKGTK